MTMLRRDATQPSADDRALRAKSPRVLVADDDADIRAALAEGLADAGFQVVEAADGNELLELVVRGVADASAMPYYDAIVADVMMGVRRATPRSRFAAARTWSSPIKDRPGGAAAADRSSRGRGGLAKRERERREQTHSQHGLTPPVVLSGHLNANFIPAMNARGEPA